MGNDLMNTLVGGAVGILAIHEVGEMTRSHRRRTAARQPTSHNKGTKSRPPSKTTTHHSTKAVKGNKGGGRVIHKGARGGKYVMRHGNRVYV